MLKKKLSVRSIMDPSIENIFDNLADSTTEPPAGLGTVENLFTPSVGIIYPICMATYNLYDIGYHL